MIRRVSSSTTSSAYTTGMVINGALAIERVTNAGRTQPILRQILVKQLTTGANDYDFIFLDSLLSTTTTLADAAVIIIDDTDLGKIVGVASATANMLFEDNSIVYVTGLNIPMSVAYQPTSPDIYFVPVIRSTSPVDMGDLEFTFVFEAG